MINLNVSSTIFNFVLNLNILENKIASCMIKSECSCVMWTMGRRYGRFSPLPIGNDPINIVLVVSHRTPGEKFRLWFLKCCGILM
jgi:hypothetical protein